MTKIILIRHGHVEGIKPERFRGRAELALTSRGIAQAKAVAKRIAMGWKPAVIYTSPMGRCVTTAELIAQSCKVPVQELSELNDLDYGAWQGRTPDEVRKARPKLLSVWYATPHLVRFPNGDSLQDLVARTADALRLMLDHHPDKTVVAVGHDSVNRALLMQLIDQPLSSYWRITQDPCCINEIDIVDGTVPRSRHWKCRVCDSPPLRFQRAQGNARSEIRRAKLPHGDLSRHVACSKGRCPCSFAN